MGPRTINWAAARQGEEIPLTAVAFDSQILRRRRTRDVDHERIRIYCVWFLGRYISRIWGTDNPRCRAEPASDLDGRSFALGSSSEWHTDQGCKHVNGKTLPIGNARLARRWRDRHVVESEKRSPPAIGSSEAARIARAPELTPARGISMSPTICCLSFRFQGSNAGDAQP